MRTSEKQIHSSLKTQIQNMLAQTLADMRTPEQAKLFMADFFTDAEVETFSKRLAISYWLSKDRSYANIKQNLKVSSATIASVQSMMEKPGFRFALKNIEAEEWATQWTERIKKFIGK